MFKTSEKASVTMPAMATIRREILIDVDPQDAWDAVRDFGALHRRLVPGFAIDARLEGDDRLVTFASGAVLRERLVACDDAQRRLVWTIVEGPYSHHNGAVQVFSEPPGTRLTWIADLLPDELAERTGSMMSQGIEVIRQTLSRLAALDHSDLAF